MLGLIFCDLDDDWILMQGLPVGEMCRLPEPFGSPKTPLEEEYTPGVCALTRLVENINRDADVITWWHNFCIEKACGVARAKGAVAN
jgi:hypothetical protein